MMAKLSNGTNTRQEPHLQHILTLIIIPIVVDPDPNWIRIQQFYGFGSTQSKIGKRLTKIYRLN